MTIHPKVQAAAIIGALYAIAVAFAQAYSYKLDPRLAGALGVLLSVLAGYVKRGPAVVDPTKPSEPDPVDPTVDLSANAPDPSA